MSDIVIRTSPHSVSGTVTHLLAVVATKGLKLFAVIDHSGEASSAGLELRETKLVIFGSPSAGTPGDGGGAACGAGPSASRARMGQQRRRNGVAYLDSGTYAERYGLTAELASRLAGVTAVVEAAIAPTADQPQEGSE